MREKCAHARHVACLSLLVNHAGRNPMAAWQTYERHAIGSTHRHSENEGGNMCCKRESFWDIVRHSSTSLPLIGQRYDPWALQHLLFSSRSSQSTSWKPRRVVVSFPSCQVVYLSLFFAGISSRGASGDKPSRLC